MTRHVLIVGAGVAGISAALAAESSGAQVTLAIPGDSLRECGGNTALAQGGVAAAIGADDLPAAHAADTVRAGAGLTDARAAALLTRAGAQRMRDLIASGFAVDRDAAGRPALGVEGAHGSARIVHAGEDRTGAALHDFLVRQVRERMRARPERIVVRAGLTLEELSCDAGSVRGALFRDAGGTVHTVNADAVVLATGGYAGLYSRTSSAEGATGTGLMAAARAGVVLADLEFVQFHPTVFADTVQASAVRATRSLLISEAVRGAGAVLLDARGRRFMLQADSRAELASRDIVAREINRVLRSQAEPVLLDATPIERESSGSLGQRFPTITAALASRGIDWAREPVPIAPAAHYTMGGVATDLAGRTTVPGLYAAGEVAATGVHGANRLASNSLLEGLVFGDRAGRTAATEANREANLEAMGIDSAPVETGQPDATFGRGIEADTVSAAIDRGLGIVRDATELEEASRTLRVATGHRAQLGQLIAHAAAARTESRGAHLRSDFSEPDPRQAVRRALRPVFRPVTVKETHLC